MSVQAMAGAQEMTMQQPADFTDPEANVRSEPGIVRLIELSEYNFHPQTVLEY
jgi:hypothetical protein